MAVNMVDLEENQLFYFESDHLALKGNKDYSELLKSIAILEAQKAKAIKDVDRLIDIKNDALKDPRKFLEKLKNNDKLGVPVPQTPASIPNINWEKYNCLIPEEVFTLINSSKSTEKDVKLYINPLTLKKEGHTHKKHWSSEEQKRLEELLVTFPPEAIEMRRYKKIAEALGNRTTKQVTSRVQKYFLKLHKAGLPIPGRIPKTNDRKKSYIHKHQRHNYYLYKPSTFFPELEVPVVMPENDDDLEPMNEHANRILQESNGDEPKNEWQLKIDLFRKLKLEKSKDLEGPLFEHAGYKCDVCQEEPIRGTRWHCFDCQATSIDFCTDCVITQLNSPNPHPLSHNLRPVRSEIIGENSPGPSKPEAEQQPSTSTQDDIKSELNSDSDSLSSDSDEEQTDYDQDYGPNNFTNDVGKYNYLDPNFLHE